MIPAPILRERVDLDLLAAGLLHVIVFGPGQGEAIAVRLPDGRWGVVDGCGSNAHGGNPVSELLVAAGVDRLLFAALTHPHEDHLLGLDEVIDTFAPEHVWWAGESHQRVFRRYIARLRKTVPDETHAQFDAHLPPPASIIKGVVASITAHTRPRVPQGRQAVGVALSDEKILLRHAPAGGPALTVRGVLPTTRSVQIGLSKLRERGAPDPSSDQLADVEPNDGDVNELSGALVLEWGETRVLLAGDALLGPTRERTRGWMWWRDRCEGPFQLVKVAHHASSGAHDPVLWATMRPTLALVTPYRNARGTMPPRPEMLKILLGSGAVGLTARPVWWDVLDHGLDGFSQTPPPALLGVPGRAPRPRHSIGSSAIAVSLDSTGQIRQIVLVGGAALLQNRGAGSIATPQP